MWLKTILYLCEVMQINFLEKKRLPFTETSLNKQFVIINLLLLKAPETLCCGYKSMFMTGSELWTPAIKDAAVFLKDQVKVRCLFSQISWPSPRNNHKTHKHIIGTQSHKEIHCVWALRDIQHPFSFILLIFTHLCYVTIKPFNTFLCRMIMSAPTSFFFF